ncbi:MAG: hypothetical protein GC162_14935 [Planctomycetes bacterium]|nr:hypothetical protein [Planctomycetota bacterium]
MPHRISRRTFLTTSAAALAGAPLCRAAGHAPAPTAEEAIAFFHIGDTHYRADENTPTKLLEDSATTTRGLIDTLNRLPGEAIPDAAGGGQVAVPRGVIHAGDLIDSGDKNGDVHQTMQQTEWAAYAADFGVVGGDARLRYPVYEVHGNHDGPGGRGLVIDRIIERNRRRTGIDHISANGLHYAWSWGAVRFINLGIVVGSDPAVKQHRRYNPLDSLDFLVDDLRGHVADKSTPVVITHHIDVARYCTAPDPADAANENREWNPCDVAAYFRAIEPYNIAAILYGHTHARNVFTWDGRSAKAAEGIGVFNVDNSSHFHSETQSFFYFEISPRQIVAREYTTKDRWRSGFWTPQVWRKTFA